MTDCKKISQHRERLDRIRKTPGIIYDTTRAEKCVSFIENTLSHFKRPHTGQPFRLDQWQKDDIIYPLYSFYRYNELGERERLFKTLYCQIGRKNGKTSLIAGMILFELFNAGSGVDILCASASIKQAKDTIYHIVSRFAETSPQVSPRVNVWKQEIETKTYKGKNPNNRVILLAGNSEKQSGHNAGLGILDELHEHTNDYLYSIVETATATQPDALMIAITTAGTSQQTICYEMYERAEDVLEGRTIDDSYLPVIYEADKDLPWDSEEAYRQANPNLGTTVRERYLTDYIKQATLQPSLKKKYEQLHLNRWVQGKTAKWLSIDQWDRCKGTVDLNELREAPCWIGFDCSKTTDLTAITALFELGGERLAMFTWYYSPEETIETKQKIDKVPYDLWEEDGFIEGLPGKVIRQDVFLENLKAILQRFNVQAVTYDPAHTSEIRHDLEALPFDLYEFRSDFASYHPSCRKFEELIIEGNLVHDGNPVTRWSAEIIPIFENATGMIRPDKKALRRKGKGRIDGIDAGLIALYPYIKEKYGDGATGRSVNVFDLPDNLRGIMGI